MARVDELLNDGRSDKPRSAGDEDSHVILLCAPRRSGATASSTRSRAERYVDATDFECAKVRKTCSIVRRAPSVHPLDGRRAAIHAMPRAACSGSDADARLQGAGRTQGNAPSRVSVVARSGARHALERVAEGAL